MARDQRRLAAIVSADVVGYCLLMGRDDSATLTRIKAHRRELIDPRIAEFGGRIVKTTGDGLLLEFPSVVDAVLCAVDVQRGMARRNAGQSHEQRIDFRIGINLGDIIIDDDDIFGDGVNVAARLQTLAEPGGICVSRVVRDQVLDKLGFTFEDLGSREVKNIAHRVKVYRVYLGAAPLQSRSWFRKQWQQVKQIPSQRWLPVCLSVLGLAGLVAWTVPRSWIFAPAPTPPTLSVAILPFAPPSDNPADVQFAEAFTKDLALTLGRDLRTAAVSSASYKGKSIDARAVGRDLNVRYVVEGDVRRTSSGIVVSTQLIATGDATQVWSDRLETEQEQAARSKNDLAVRLTQRLRVGLLDAERRRVGTQKTAGASAMDLVLRAMNVLDTGSDPLKAALEARKLSDEALRLDPNLLTALLLRGLTLQIQRELDPQADGDWLLQEEDKDSKHAVAVGRDDQRAWQFRSAALLVQGRLEAALEANSEAVRLDTTSGGALLHRAAIMVLKGDPAESVALVDKAIALNPNADIAPGGVGNAGLYRCRALLALGRYDDAIAACQSSAVQNDQWITHLYLVAAYAQSGNADQSAVEKMKLLKQRPGLTIAEFKKATCGVAVTPAYLGQSESHLYTGLRKAGIPES